MSLIHVNNLTKHFKVLNRREGLSGAFRDLFSGDYRTVKAVDGISFDIEAGEIVGYIGPNGAGKSTTIKMMTGILKPTSGEIIQVSQADILPRGIPAIARSRTCAPWTNPSKVVLI